MLKKKKRRYFWWSVPYFWTRYWIRHWAYCNTTTFNIERPQFLPYRRKWIRPSRQISLQEVIFQVNISTREEELKTGFLGRDFNLYLKGWNRWRPVPLNLRGPSGFLSHSSMWLKQLARYWPCWAATWNNTVRGGKYEKIAERGYWGGITFEFLPELLQEDFSSGNPLQKELMWTTQYPIQFPVFRLENSSVNQQCFSSASFSSIAPLEGTSHKCHQLLLGSLSNLEFLNYSCLPCWISQKCLPNKLVRTGGGKHMSMTILQ